MTLIRRGFDSRRLHPSLVARSDERSPSKREVAGSTPAGATRSAGFESPARFHRFGGPKPLGYRHHQPGASAGSSPERDGAQQHPLSAVLSPSAAHARRRSVVL